MRKKRLPLVILLSIAVSFMLYFFISNRLEEPEIQIVYVLPTEPIKAVTKRRSRYFAAHAQSTGLGERHESMEVQHELPDEMEHDTRDFNTIATSFLLDNLAAIGYNYLPKISTSVSRNMESHHLSKRLHRCIALTFEA